jgi:hypothetical protein
MLEVTSERNPPKMKYGPAALFLMASFLIASPAFAQDLQATLRARAACGSETVQFNATADAHQHLLAQAEAGKAGVYVIGSFVGHSPAKPTVKVGVDGGWVGAIRGNSYIFTSVQPGEHHICVNWQSGLVTPSGLFAMANFTAEAGKTYYFRARTFAETNSAPYLIDLDATNNDEGQYLVASSAISKSHPKK